MLSDDKGCDFLKNIDIKGIIVSVLKKRALGVPWVEIIKRRSKVDLSPHRISWTMRDEIEGYVLNVGPVAPVLGMISSTEKFPSYPI